MPLAILLPLVVLGIAGITLLLHLLGRSQRHRIAGAEEAAALWQRHWPGDAVSGAKLTPDGHAALINAAGGKGLLWSFGADTTARRLDGATAAPCPTGLRIDFHDFTAPPLKLRLPEGMARDWLTEMEDKAP